MDLNALVTTLVFRLSCIWSGGFRKLYKDFLPDRPTETQQLYQSRLGCGAFEVVYRGVLPCPGPKAQQLDRRYYSTKRIPVVRRNRSLASLEESRDRVFCLLIFYIPVSRRKWKQGTAHSKSYNSRCDSAAEDNSKPAPMNTPNQSNWRIASGAVNHLTGDQNMLTDYTPILGDRTVHVPHLGPMQVHGCGTVNTPNVVLQNVWYVPGLELNLVSAGQLTKIGYKVSFGPYGCRISKGSDDNVVGKARFTEDYQFEVEFVKVSPIGK
ncbi:hypothetical protein ACP70R_008675 [Stipagrostis hirtigluma subsp. patula]